MLVSAQYHMQGLGTHTPCMGWEVSTWVFTQAWRVAASALYDGIYIHPQVLPR